MIDALAQLLAHFFARLLGRLRLWIGALPPRDFADTSPLDKVGRLLMMLAVVLLVLGPAGWLIWR